MLKLWRNISSSCKKTNRCKNNAYKAVATLMTYKIYKKKNNKNDKAKITKNVVFQ